MAETMKALVKAKSEVGIWMEDVPIPKIEPNEVLIRVNRTSICGTDMHIYKWDKCCLLYTSPSPRDATLSRMPSSA